MRAGVRMEDMMLRRVIEIEEEKCNGCGACANACHEGAISIVNGKAKLMRDDYCDGLGDCLPTCPMDAIHFVEREAAAYDAAAVEENKRKKAAQQAIASQPLPCGCPGTQAKTIRHEQQAGPGGEAPPPGAAGILPARRRRECGRTYVGADTVAGADQAGSGARPVF